MEVLLGILGGGVPPGSPNPDHISDQKMSFSTPVFRPQKFMPIFRPGGGNKTQHYMFTTKQKLCHQSFLKSISNSHFTLSFLFSWN